MSFEKRFGDIEFGGPATYRIIVQGVVTEQWAKRLGDMTVTIRIERTGSSRTMLFGQIRDQAELSGLLEALYGLHLPILEVTTVEDENGEVH